MNCKDCRHWREITERHQIVQYLGECKNPRLMEPWYGMDAVSTGEDYQQPMWAGPLFGCVHFEAVK